MPHCHLKITNATIIDGSGNAAYQADIAIETDRIIEIGALNHYQADEKIDVNGWCVSPGFIDVHTTQQI